jgi:branched-chain amino acid transport system permease protein
VLLGVIETVGGFIFPSSYKDVIVFGLLILVLLLWPSGLFGRSDRSV